MRFNTHPALRALLHSVDPTPPGEPDGGGSGAMPPAPEPAGGGEPQGDSAEDVAKLKRALESERALKRQLESQLKQVGQVNPELLQQARAQAEAAEQQRQFIEQQMATRLAEQQRKHEEQMASVRSELQERTAKAEREALRVKAQAEFLASEGLAEASKIDGTMPFDYVWARFGHRYAEGAGGLYLLEEDGRTPSLDDDGKPKTLRKHFAELSIDPVHGANFKPKYGSGSGSRNGRDGVVDLTTDMNALPQSALGQMAFRKGGRR
jgi:multidrug efflux pump subunit AcrA (membrane-fusion protein)